MSGRKRAPQTVTITDVAQAARVSRSTVSRVFSRPSVVRPATVALVRQVALGLGYVPNPSAIALSTGKMAAIGVVVPDIGNPFFPPLIRAAGIRATAAGVAILIADTGENADREAEALERLATRTDGIVLVSSRQRTEAVTAFARRARIVLVNRDLPGIPRVLVDTAGGVRHAVEHLAGLGHRHVAYLVGPRHSWSNRERRAAVVDAAAGLGIEVSAIKGFGPTYDEGMRAAATVLGSGATALIAFDDLMAQGVMAGLRRDGLSVPNDLSVVGCDNFLATQTFPQLTSIQARSAEAGAAAVELLLAPADPKARLVLAGDLVIRATTASPARGEPAAQQVAGRAGA